MCSAHSCSHSVTLTGYLNSLSECIAYPVGTSCSVGSAVAVPCAPGAYNNRTAGDVCVKCAPRAPSKSCGLSDVVQPRCTPGYYWRLGAAAALPRPGSTHKNASLSVMTSADQCVVFQEIRSGGGGTREIPCFGVALSVPVASEARAGDSISGDTCFRVRVL